jgi:DNA helicase INO80
MGYQARVSQLERIAKLASFQARKPFTRPAKATKEMQAKAKRLMREMLVFWKKNEREERDVRKREQKEAIDRAKIEEEKREAARQARKLEFLISQTELYSHFVGSKLKSKSLVYFILFFWRSLYSFPITAAEVEGDGERLVLAAANIGNVDLGELQEINFDDGEFPQNPNFSHINPIIRGHDEFASTCQIQCTGGRSASKTQSSAVR